ncbi:MAG: hypothetical protein JWR24_4009 [Actinoallomurus sp.]|nr:hypothetical protein [Actinoallomurus sp.]
MRRTGSCDADGRRCPSPPSSSRTLSTGRTPSTAAMRAARDVGADGDRAGRPADGRACEPRTSTRSLLRVGTGWNPPPSGGGGRQRRRSPCRDSPRPARTRVRSPPRRRGAGHATSHGWSPSARAPAAPCRGGRPTRNARAVRRRPRRPPGRRRPGSRGRLGASPVPRPTAHSAHAGFPPSRVGAAGAPRGRQATQSNIRSHARFGKPPARPCDLSRPEMRRSGRRRARGRRRWPSLRRSRGRTR